MTDKDYDPLLRMNWLAVVALCAGVINFGCLVAAIIADNVLGVVASLVLLVACAASVAYNSEHTR